MKKSTLIKLGILVGTVAGSAVPAQVVNFHDANQGTSHYNGYNVLMWGPGAAPDPGNNVWNGFGQYPGPGSTYFYGPNNPDSGHGSVPNGDPGQPYAWFSGTSASGANLFSPTDSGATDAGNANSDGSISPVTIILAYGFDNGANGGITQGQPSWILSYAAVVNSGSPGIGTADNPLGSFTLENVPLGTYDLYLYGANFDGTRGGSFAITTGGGTPVGGFSGTMNTNAAPTGNALDSFILGETYVEFTGIVPVGGVISGTWGAVNNSNSGLSGEGDFNGLQLVAVSVGTNGFAPATVTNLPATGIGSKGATLNGKVLTTGRDTPAVTIYYGSADGGTNAAAWSNNVALGYEDGLFAGTVTGLSPGTAYYFTAAAANALGTAWARPSLSLTTAVVTLPLVSNLPAANVEANSATLQGQVIATGNDTTVVTVYYGTADGGTNAGSWPNKIALGPQSGLFEQTVTGLSSNTIYYYTASVANGAGTNWAAPSQTLTTLRTNLPSLSAVAVLTQHDDNGRTGMNLNETILNAANVNANQFGLLYTRPVDDQIYAQPLVATNVNLLGRGTHNIVIVATVNDTVYAFDADDASATAPYWATSFINPPDIVPPANFDESSIGACGGTYRDFSGQFGIVGAPVIDPVAGTIYLVARTKEYGTNFVQRLHALDITTGLDRTNSPVIIQATYPGTGSANTNGVIPFDPLRQNQRAGLLLVNGVIYIAWTSHCDNTPYHGWVMAYDPGTLEQLAVFNDSPNGDQAGIWMSNGGPAADTNGNVYVSTANGDFDGVHNFGESFLKLTRDGTNISVTSWFTPYNWPTLNNNDQDLGSGGVLLIPGTNLLFSGGKGGVAYLVNRDNMGGVSSGSADTNIVQSFTVTSDEVHGGAVWWDGPGASYGYLWPASANLQQYQFDRASGMFVLPAFALSATIDSTGEPGGILALSANGTNAGSAIVWAAHQLDGDANQQVLPGILHAYDAQNVTNELWNSEEDSARDSAGNFAKFVAPTVANGKVYLATFSGQLDVYGLLPLPTLNVALSGGNTIITWPANPFPGFALQANTNLSANNWFDVTNNVVTSNGLYQVTIPVSGDGTFYRLKR